MKVNFVELFPSIFELTKCSDERKVIRKLTVIPDIHKDGRTDRAFF